MALGRRREFFFMYSCEDKFILGLTNENTSEQLFPNHPTLHRHVPGFEQYPFCLLQLLLQMAIDIWLLGYSIFHREYLHLPLSHKNPVQPGKH